MGHFRFVVPSKPRIMCSRSLIALALSELAAGWQGGYQAACPNSPGFNKKNMCIDIPGGDASPGTALWMWSCDSNNANQHWNASYAPDAIPFDGRKSVFMGPQKKPSLCVDVLGGDLTNGNPVGLWECNSGENQNWFWDDSFSSRAGGSALVLKSTSWGTSPLNGKCVTASGSENGSALVIWDCERVVGD